MRPNYLDTLHGLAIFIVVHCHFIRFKLNLQYTSHIASFVFHLWHNKDFAYKKCDKK